MVKAYKLRFNSNLSLNLSLTKDMFYATVKLKGKLTVMTRLVELD